MFTYTSNFVQFPTNFVDYSEFRMKIDTERFFGTHRKKLKPKAAKRYLNNIIVLMWIITIKCVECNVRRFSLVGNMLYLTEPKMNMYEWKLQHVIIMLLLYSHHPIIIARINVVKVLLSAQVYLEQIAFECIKTSKKIWEKNKKFYEKFYCVLKE